MNAFIDNETSIPTKYGTANLITFRDLADGKEHFAFAFGAWRSQGIPLVRIHSECVTGDVFGSERCDCGPQLDEAMNRFSKVGGIILYLRQEGRGIGLVNKMRAYTLQEQGLNTYEANRQLGFADDERDFEVAAQMLNAMGILGVRLLSNNPRKATQLERHGISVNQRVFTKTHVCDENKKYLLTKSTEGGHDGLLDFQVAVAK